MDDKFESYYQLDSEMSQYGLGHTLSEAEDIEMMASRRRGQRTSRGKIQDRLLEWFNNPPQEGCCDLTSLRPSYCMIDAIKKEYVRKKALRGR